MLNASDDYNCICAIARIVPRIDMRKIEQIIDETPLISDNRKNFYKVMINERKERFLDHALEIHIDRGDIVYEDESIEAMNSVKDKKGLIF